MKIIDLLNASPILNKMMDRKMPAKLAYALVKNARLINHELEIYDQARINILQANWIMDPKTNQYKIPKEDQEKWQGLHNDLIQAESDYQPFKVDFGLTEKVELTPGELMALWFIFDGADDLAPIPALAAGPDPAADPARARARSRSRSIAAGPAPTA